MSARASRRPRSPTTPNPSPDHPAADPQPSPIAIRREQGLHRRKLYTNNVLPSGEGEFATSGLDVNGGAASAATHRRKPVLGLPNLVGPQSVRYVVSDRATVSAARPVRTRPDTDAPGSPRASDRRSPMPIARRQPRGRRRGLVLGRAGHPVDCVRVLRRSRAIAAPTRNVAGMVAAHEQRRPEGPHGSLAGEWDVQEMFGNDLGNGMNAGTILWNSGSNIAAELGRHVRLAQYGAVDAVAGLPRLRSVDPSGRRAHLKERLRSGRARLSVRSVRQGDHRLPGRHPALRSHRRRQRHLGRRLERNDGDVPGRVARQLMLGTPQPIGLSAHTMGPVDPRVRTHERALLGVAPGASVAR